MELPPPPAEEIGCSGVSEVLSRVGEKWSIQVVVTLRDRPHRFNEMKRQIAGISQQMLTRTLKTLERDGLVNRKVCPTTPPQVEYTLTSLGHSLAEPVRCLAEWARAHLPAIHLQRRAYDAQHQCPDDR